MAASSDFASWRGLRINAHAPCQMRIVRGKAIDLAQLRYASDVVGHRIAPNRTACGLGGRVFCARGPPPLRQIAPTGALCFTTVGPGSNALYAEVFSHWTPRIRHHVKEFYCSTTRNSRPAGAMRLGQGGSGPKGRLTSCVPIRRWYARKVSWTRSAGGTRHFKGSCDIRRVSLAVFTGVVRGASQRDAPCIVPDHPRTPVIHREEIQRTSFAGRTPIRPKYLLMAAGYPAAQITAVALERGQVASLDAWLQKWRQRRASDTLVQHYVLSGLNAALIEPNAADLAAAW